MHGLRYVVLFCLISLAILETLPASSQVPKDNTKLYIVGISGGVIYTGALIGLNQYWYAKYPKSKFHFFNDNDEWQQMDKAGHCFTSYYEGYYGMKMLQWAGLPKDKAIWYGGTWGLLLQTPIEIMDGFSSEWGFSWGDELANFMGTVILIGQEYAFGEQRFLPKFSYFPTEFARQDPNMFGQDIFENVIKDYNGQNYWLSTPVNGFIQNTYIPKWLSISIGIGATGMTRGTKRDQDNDPRLPHYKRARQFCLAFDVNLPNINTNSQVAAAALSALAWIKLPSPTIEYTRYRGFKGHFLYF